MTTSSQWTDGRGRLFFLAFYLLFGLIHELAHIFFARVLLPSEELYQTSDEIVNSGGVIAVFARAFFGRYCFVSIPKDNPVCRAIILHSGWVFTLLLAICLHVYHRHLVSTISSNRVCASWVSIASVAAYLTTLEGAITDLFGFLPASWLSDGPSAEGKMILYCGNFGVILLNSSWINVDGGKTALDMLEKMVEVTMMRGKCM
jgi:hypothetical protein